LFLFLFFLVVSSWGWGLWPWWSNEDVQEKVEAKQAAYSLMEVHQRGQEKGSKLSMVHNGKERTEESTQESLDLSM